MYEELLYLNESDSLDFKSKQYKFIKCKEEKQKAEILKDILAFANSWVNGDRHILIGVKEKPYPPHEVVGINENIDDATLQQFINSKTNIPVNFSYTTERCNGLPIGVIKITHQKRPVYLKKKYGGISADVVLVRHGSSTDHASSQEIADMVKHDQRIAKEPQFKIEFYDDESGEPIGERFEAEFKYDSSIPKSELLPDFQGTKSFREKINDHLYTGNLITTSTPNENYIREILEYSLTLGRTKLAKICVTNLSSVIAKSVNIQFEISFKSNIKVIREEDLPIEPNAYIDKFTPYGINELINNQNINVQQEIIIKNYSSKQVVYISCGDIQPKQTIVIGDKLVLQAKKMPINVELKMELKMSGDNVSNPQSHLLFFKAKSSNTELGWEKFVKELTD